MEKKVEIKFKEPNIIIIDPKIVNRRLVFRSAHLIKGHICIFNVMISKRSISAVIDNIWYNRYLGSSSLDLYDLIEPDYSQCNTLGRILNNMNDVYRDQNT